MPCNSNFSENAVFYSLSIFCWNFLNILDRKNNFTDLITKKLKSKQFRQGRERQWKSPVSRSKLPRSGTLTWMVSITLAKFRCVRNMIYLNSCLMSKSFSNEKDSIVQTFVELHFMLFHGYECSMDGAVKHAINALKWVDRLANHLLSTSSNKF